MTLADAISQCHAVRRGEDVDIELFTATINALSAEDRQRLDAAVPGAQVASLFRRIDADGACARRTFLGAVAQLGEHQHGIIPRDDTGFAQHMAAILGDSAQDRIGAQLVDMTLFGVLWFECGMPRLEVGHKHAAALMATRVPSDLLSELRPPWHAFVADVPEGLVSWEHDDGRLETLAHVALLSIDNRFRLFLATRSACLGVIAGPSLSDVLSLDHHPSVDTVQNGRAYELAARFALGMCLEATAHRPACEHGASPRAVRRDKRGAPRSWVFKLSRAVTIDCRDAVRAYGRGEGRSPTVQSLVRGHWKWQRCGPQSSGRRYIPIDPYWRGPDDAPIALRAHVLSTPKDAP